MLDNKFASLVSGTNHSKFETVRRNFIEKKLGVSDKDKVMAAIKSVTIKMSSIRIKSRPALYYLVPHEFSSLNSDIFHVLSEASETFLYP